MADNEGVPEEELHAILPILAQKKDEAEWYGWYTEQIKKKSEKRVIVVGQFRVFFFAFGKKDVKLIRDANLLELQEMNSKSTDTVQLVFKSFTVDLLECNADDCITSIRQSYENTFFGVPKAKRFKLGVDDSRLKNVEGPNQATLAKSCGSFSATYQALCDFYRTNVRSDICWDMDNLLPANHVKEFDMKEFEQPLTPADFRALVEALQFNSYFTGFIAHDYKLDKDAMKIIADMLFTNEKMERLHLVSADGVAAGFEQIGTAISKNKKAAITSIDWSFNKIEDRGTAALAAAITSLSHGMTLLNIAHGDATKKGTAPLCNSLKANPHIARSLQILNLAYNRLDVDGSQSLATFLSTPNVLREINIASTNANLEVMFPALTRGCAELVTLDVSGNKMPPKAGADFKTYLSSCSKLREINLADTGIPVNIARDVLKGIIGNKYFANVSLNLSSNKLGVLGANMIAGVAEEFVAIEKLDLSSNEFGDEGIGILAEGLCRCPSLKDLNLADNFTKGKGKTRTTALDNLVELISSDCPLERLSLAASNPAFAIQLELLPFIYALATNDFLVHLDISGHGMGDKGGIALGKVLQTNRTLQSLLWDSNNTMLAGIMAFKIGLERNTVLTVMPLPILDISQALKLQSNDVNKIQAVVNQISEAIARNQSPKSKFAMEGFSQHISLVGAGEREEVQKLRLRIKAAPHEPNAEQRKVLVDAENNDTYIAALHSAQEELQQAMEDEVASKLGKFAAELCPFLVSTHVQLVDRLMHKIEQSYQSLDKEVIEKLRTDLGALANESVQKDAISKVLAVAAAQQITSQVGKSFVTTVEMASDTVFDQLLSKLEDTFYALQKGGSVIPPRSPRRASSSGDESKGEDTGEGLSDSGEAAQPQTGSVPPKKVPPPTPSRTSKPGAKPTPPPKKPVSTPRKGGGGGASSSVPEKVPSNIKTHMTKDRPQGPQRRRPQRKPQRRPMMEGNE